MDLRLDWVPKDLNTEADELSNMNFSSFSLENRIDVDLNSLNFKLLKEMLESGEQMYKQLALLKAQKLQKMPWKGSHGVRARLRDRQPW